jgi:NodT family efflux transporter outer membrane factor (OMF) lipoprotein
MLPRMIVRGILTTVTSSQLSRRGLAALALLGGAGCSAVPSPGSGIDLPGRFSAAPPAPANWPDISWWQGFGSPELNALMEAAIGANFDVRAAEARVRQADANLRITGQRLLPTGNLTANTQRTQTPSQTATAANFGGRSRYIQREFFQTQLQASWEVDFWGRNRRAVEAAERTASAARFEVGAVLLTTQASVANTYFNVLAAREQLVIQEANVASAQRILNLLQQRVNAGTADGLDVAQQRTLLEQQRAAIPPLRQTAEQNTYSLGTLIGAVPESVAPPRQPLAEIRIPQPSPGLPVEVLVRRPDVWQAEATLASAQANIESARAALLPTIQLTTTGGFQNIVLENLLRPGSVLYSLAAGLTQPIFQLGQLRAQVRLTEAQAEELLELYRQAIVSALVDVENAIVALRETTEQEALQASALRSAERAYSISDAQLRAGTIDLITVLNTQLNVFTARNNLAQVRLARLQAAVALFRALGGGWA